MLLAFAVLTSGKKIVHKTQDLGYTEKEIVEKDEWLRELLMQQVENKKLGLTTSGYLKDIIAQW